MTSPFVPPKPKPKTSCLGAVSSLVIALSVVPLEGALFMLYWEWFVQLAFPSAPTLTYRGAVALSLVVGLLNLDNLFAFTQVVERLPKSTTPGWARSLAHALLIVLMLVVGYLLHLVLGGPPVPLT